MDNLIWASPGGTAQQQRVLELTLCALKEILPSITGEIKDSASLKKGLAGYWEWKKTKEILGWVVDKKKGTLWLSTKLKAYLLSLLNAPHTRQLMAVKFLERLIGKLRSMHLAVPGAIGNFYAMQLALTCDANWSTAYLSARFHLCVYFWRDICKAMDPHPT